MTLLQFSHTSAFPRRESPEFFLYPSPKEGVALP